MWIYIYTYGRLMVDIALQRKGIWLYIHMAIFDIALQRRGIWQFNVNKIVFCVI